MSRVVVVGGGVIGCAIAERLSLERHQVTLLERDQLGCRASGAAAGGLSPQSGTSPADPEALRSLAMFPAHTSPRHVLFAPSPAPPPSTAPTSGKGMPATGFDIADDEVRRVITPAGAREVDWAVIAAGPWSREVASAAGVDVDVRPQRGQLAALDPGATVLNRSLVWSRGYLVPKADGTITAGVTEEDSGFDDRPTVAGVATCSTSRGGSRRVSRPRACCGRGPDCDRSRPAAVRWWRLLARET